MSHLTRITSARDAVPVNLLPSHLISEPRVAKIPLDFSFLSRRQPSNYIVSPGDTLGIYLQGMDAAAQNEATTALSVTVNAASSVAPNPGFPDPNVYSSNGTRSNAYPATGLIRAPFVGFPIMVSDDGSVLLPLVGSLSLENLTLPQAAEAIRRAYTIDRKIIQPGQDRIIVTRIKPRVHRVIVIRDDLDSSYTPSYYSLGKVPYTKRGNSIVLDLPAYENDVLHALIASGGLPGIDAISELYVMHGNAQQAIDGNSSNLPSPSIAQENRSIAPVTRIPLQVNAGEPLPFSERDVILEDGDILHVRSREAEVFYTGGLLAGGRIPLPRDRDIDVLEAIALATGAPGGYPGSIISLFRAYNGAGGMIKPTRVIVVRSLPDHEQVRISIDLNRAAEHAENRLMIRPNDIVLLEYKPSEFVANAALGLLHVNLVLVNSSSPNKVSTTTTTSQGNNPEPPPDQGGSGNP